MSKNPIFIVGAGLAGSEAAWQAAQAGAQVNLVEMRPKTKTDAHQTGDFAELVCSNSFRSDDAENNAVGLLHEEMRRGDSLIMAMADRNKVPAGGALAVDREAFAQSVTKALHEHPRIDIEYREITSLDDVTDENAIIATGPLTAQSLAESILAATGEDALAFFDAIAPIVYKESINFDRAWFQSRYDKKGPGGDGADYINCALSEDEYNNFIQALCNADTADFKEWEKSTPYFEGCLPIEVMAARGPETLRFGPMKPVGLTNPHTDERPHAVVQLRQDNTLGTLYNLVGFQTKMKYGAQSDVFRMIPGLENAEFARLGGVHRNTFLNSPKLLDHELRLRARPSIRFAGQITGVEGYLESAAIGFLAGRFAAAQYFERNLQLPPEVTAFGSLIGHITGGHMSDSSRKTFQPMNVNFGLFPEMTAPSRDSEGRRLRGKEKGRAKKRLMCQRALDGIDEWFATHSFHA